jgi:hypothetical protein
MIVLIDEALKTFAVALKLPSVGRIVNSADELARSALFADSQ